MINNNDLLNMMKDIGIYDILTNLIIENIYRSGYNGFDAACKERNKMYTNSDQDIVDTTYKELEEEINED